MSNQISSRDWEDLSAYMDGQLSRRRHARMEARLRREPELRSALEELRRTRALLSALPRVRAPRNFTLTPEMVGSVRKRPRLRLFSTFRLASAMASLLLLIVLVGDIVGVGMLRPEFQRVAEPSEPVVSMQEAPAEPDMMLERQVTPEAEQELEVRPESPLTEAPELETAVEEMVDQAESPAAEAEPAMAPTLTEDTSGVSKIPEHRESFTQSESIMAVPDNTPTSSFTEMPELEPPAVTTPILEAESEPIPESPPELNVLRGVEITLAAIAVMTGLAALYFRRRG